MNKRCFAVTGRIPFDDEDSTYIYFVETRERAVDIFEEEIYDNSGRTDQEEVRIHNEQAVYVTGVLVSDSPIEVLS